MGPLRIYCHWFLRQRVKAPTHRKSGIPAARLLAEYRDGTTYFVHEDHLGSTRLLSKLDKTILDSVDYMPFGEQIAGDSGTTHKFTGKERDTESGLDNFGARYDSSSLGRFMSPDWAEDPQAVPYANFRSPQSLNLYSYAGNNPLSLVDFDGHFYGPKCDFLCWLKHVVFGDPHKTRPAPNSHDPIGPVIVNTFVGLYNLGNRILSWFP
jgi:RHS repeat-associated protein